jgi:LexA-binding, inner membrane-associated putative hydrolase
MPGYKGHLSGGLVLFVSCLLLVKQYYCPSLCTIIEWLSCTLLGSVFPDIDVKSKGQKWFYWLLLVLFLYLFACRSYFILSIFGIIALVPMLVRHRGLFHKAWFILLIGATIVMLTAAVAPSYVTRVSFDLFFFLIGAFSHLWLDFGFRRMLRW